MGNGLLDRGEGEERKRKDEEEEGIEGGRGEA
jgi:hypothetical protein